MTSLVVRSTRAFAASLALLVLLSPAFASAQRAAGTPGKPSAVVLVGMPGGGKSTAAGRAENRLRVPRFTSGDAIRRGVAQRGLPYTAENDRMVSAEFAKQPGQIGRTVAEEAVRSGSGFVVVEGFRDKRELAAFRQLIPNTVVVSVEVGTKRRHARMLGRGRAGEDNPAYLRRRDSVETGLGVRGLMRGADMRIRPRGENLASLDRSMVRVLTKIDPALGVRYKSAAPMGQETPAAPAAAPTSAAPSAAASAAP